MTSSISEQLLDALGMMIMGMSLVFIFLSILIIGINLVARLCQSDIQPVVANAPTPVPAAATSIDPKLIAAITSAIHQYRAKD
ncbi:MULTISPECIES: OadG family transporter subunit [unclassified Shewanella]|uniref:OadG family protein n=1 Tax=unclassified Shewanella TaxID=196818 RepID=UPI0009709D0C|nr:MULTISPECIES: OadG family transporter subunit [unclassified Shewanella]MDO6642065.1 OadG family transporter subunit [Shewanella sp. 5_MG-2023]MDO6776382.1 OadG family transporter subunit [Shewanella sp. 3_MG-2023]PMG27018.1 sodium pump decarboxylase subunit gamma [Shewanella sp. 10N.286.52.C2]PMG44447.1 sodium pump decarboxylase subunit gamma [Shewanella sp. 10N.286.52.B9]PMH87158.1 sodium pump decarboxylase subunit gamma [Shewanella sp. 10N.286.48.B5]